MTVSNSYSTIWIDGLPPGSEDDRELTLAFQRGEKGSYQAIHERHEERVHRVCRRMLGKPEDAQEAAQETFLRVYSALSKFNGRYQLGAWITRIATNVCLDDIRARSRRPVHTAPLEELDMDLPSDCDSDPETMTIRNAESRRVRKILQGLPPLHRAAIVLRDFEGLSYSDVAIALGMTDPQVKALIHRARKNFRRSWTPLAEMLIPARLLHKLRDLQGSVKDPIVQTAAAHTAPVASACGGLIQNCGTFVADKMVPFVASVLVGGVALASPNNVATPTQTNVAVVRKAPVAESTTGVIRERAPRPVVAPAPTEADPASETEEPAPDPEPSVTPTEEPPPDDETPPEPAPTPTPAPAAPFMPTFYFDQGQAPSPRAPFSNLSTVDCDTRSIDQTLSGTITDASGAYPIDVRIKTISSLQIEFTVHKNGFAVYYSGLAPLTGASQNQNRLTLTFTGRYGTGPTAAQSAGLPVNGSIHATFVLDCSAHTLVTESVAFTTQ